MKKAEEDWILEDDLDYTLDEYRPQYDGRWFEGTAYVLYPKSEAVSKVMEYEHGYLHGIYQKYYEDGYLKSWGNYQKGQASGRWEYYDEDANLIKTELYRPPYGLLKAKSWSPDLRLLHRLDRHHFGPTKGEYFQLEQKFDDNGQLRQEKAEEYGILVAQGDWDEHGNLVDSFILQEGGPSYSQWLKHRQMYTAENPYELSF